MPDELDSLIPSRPETVIFVHTIQCSSCMLHFDPPTMVTLESIQRSDDGWKASGRAHCPRCAGAATAIITEIPILASSFECPSCHHVDTLHYTINAITKSKEVGHDHFDFEVEIKCSKCSKKRSFKKALKALLDIIKIEIKPTGIEVKKG